MELEFPIKTADKHWDAAFDGCALDPKNLAFSFDELAVG